MFKNSTILSRQAKAMLASDYLKSKHSNEALNFHFLELRSSKSGFHQSQIQEYPATRPLPLPPNIKDLASVEKLKFSPLRNRDINGSFISFCTSSNVEECKRNSNFMMDDRIECYDCSGTINLSSTMQTNVPYPFTSKGKPTHLNMPGGQWRQKEKYISEELNNLHHINRKGLGINTGGTCILGVKTGNKNFYLSLLTRNLTFQSLHLWFKFNINQFQTFCTVREKVKEFDEKSTVPKVEIDSTKLTLKQKLKAAIKDYGPVIIVFHVGISLISLGCCYVAIASGVDLTSIVNKWGVEEGAATAGTAATFVVAYAIHKAMSPVRIAITLTAAPFVVKKLRKIGFLKPPK